MGRACAEPIQRAQSKATLGPVTGDGRPYLQVSADRCGEFTTPAVVALRICITRRPHGTEGKRGLSSRLDGDVAPLVFVPDDLSGRAGGFGAIDPGTGGGRRCPGTGRLAKLITHHARLGGTGKDDKRGNREN